MNKAFVFASYNLQTQLLNLLAWLEVDGEIDTGATNCRIRLFPQSAPTVAAVDETVASPHTPGQFTAQVTSLDLDVGAPYFATVEIEDTGSVVRTSGAALVIL